MNKLLLFFFLFFSASGLYSQSDSIPVDSTNLSYDTLSFRSFYIKTSPLTPFDLFNGGSVNLVVESFPVKRISVSPEMGFYYPLNGLGFKNLRGWRSGLEIRYYYKFLYDSIGSEGQFIGIRYLHKGNSFDVTDSIDQGLSSSYLKSYHLTKSVDIADFVWGLRYQPWHGMEKEFYVGLGVRYKDATIDGLTSTEIDERDWGNDTNIQPRLLSNGETIDVDILIGFRFGFGIK
ncbi:MAG TPA: hypothetical protein VL651_04685 [Bacteroidia bacterium]|jgi:hypothetical protein|nr:hypothetical protein [Bacteroidia bacterium]